MQNQDQNSDDPHELMIEERLKRVSDRPKKLDSLVDTQAMRFLEAMDFQSYGELSSAFEKFMMDSPLFQGDVSFGRAAAALDLTASLFSIIDTDKNHLLSREEFAYMLLKANDANRQALAWLVENFNAFTQACFFKDQISKDDIEAGRNVFHGLKVINEKLGFNKQPTHENLQNLNPKDIKDFLAANKGKLTQHESAGLEYLLEHMKKHNKYKGDSTAKLESIDKNLGTIKDKRFDELAAVMDQKSLKTLKGLKLNSFEGLFNAFAEFIEDSISHKGETPFDKAANALDASASIISDLDMGEDHMFTRDELLIVSKMTPKDKKQMGWVVKHFDAFTRAFFLPGKAKKKDLRSAKNIFQGLSFTRNRMEREENLDQQLRDILRAQGQTLEPQSRVGVEQLVQFMEKHSN